MDSRAEIENLLAQYAFLYDDGDLEGYARLFVNGEISGITETEQILEHHRSGTYSYGGIPRTRHVISNIHIDIDEEAGTASSRCYPVLWQQVPPDPSSELRIGFPLQLLQVGSYIDTFKRIGGKWFFATRRHQRHLLGDLTHHAWVPFTD